jgi:addiction module HigA family antidote
MEPKKSNSQITTKEVVKMTKQLPPLHPGEVLREEFIKPLGLSAGRVAKAIDVPRTRIERIVTEKAGITGNTAIRLGKLFRTTPEFWMNLQAAYELQTVAKEIQKEVGKIEPALLEQRELVDA